MTCPPCTPKASALLGPLASSRSGVSAAEAPWGGCPSLAPVLAVTVGVQGAAGGAGGWSPAPTSRPQAGLLAAGPRLLPSGWGTHGSRCHQGCRRLPPCLSTAAPPRDGVFIPPSG